MVLEKKNRVCSLFVCLVLFLSFASFLLGSKGYADVPRYNPKNPNQKPGLYRTDNMHYSRIDHQATLLQDGRVLVTGGWSPGDCEAAYTSEIYDPKTGKFTDGPKMNYKHAHHKAVLLQDGRVFIIGGAYKGAYNYLNATEFYNPKTNKFEKGPESIVYHPENLSPFNSLNIFVLKNGEIYIKDTNISEYWNIDHNKFKTELKVIYYQGKNKINILKTAIANKNSKWMFNYIHPPYIVYGDNFLFFEKNYIKTYNPRTNKAEIFMDIGTKKFYYNSLLKVNEDIVFVIAENNIINYINLKEKKIIDTNIKFENFNQKFNFGTVEIVNLYNNKILLSKFNDNSWLVPFDIFDVSNNSYVVKNDYIRSSGSYICPLKNKNQILITGGRYKYYVNPNKKNIANFSDKEKENKYTTNSKFAYIYIY